MSLRRMAAPALALALASCAKDVSPEGSPAFVDHAVFDPSVGAVPLPNDLALLPQSVEIQPPGAQRELLEAFQVTGGFPNDLEVPITIEFTRVPVGGSGAASAPELDVGSIVAPGGAEPNLLVLRVGGFGATPVAFEVAGYLAGAGKGTLTLRKAPAGGSRLWEPGQYVVAVRGGPHGVKTAGGGEVHPQPAMYLLLQGKNLAYPENQALLPDAAAGELLEQIRQSYLAPFSLVEAVFPAREIAVLQTFRIAPARTHVVLDPAAGVAPLPSNFLLDHSQSPPKVAFNPAFGPAAAGLATLDGFSTTGMLMAPMSAPIDSTTVTNESVLVYRVAGGVAERVFEVMDHVSSGCSGAVPATFVAQPPPLSPSPVPVIALQPAVPVPLPGGLCGGALMLPPLEEASDYVVVITSRVKDATGAPIGRTTPASLLLFSSALVADGAATVPGVDPGTAQLLDLLRQQIQPALQALPSGVTRGDVAFAYPVRTQSITGAALELAALPYSPDAAMLCAMHGVDCEKPRPGSTRLYTPDGVGADGSIEDLFAKHGVDPLVPRAGIGVALETEIFTLDLLDPATGAFLSDPANLVPRAIPALVLAPADRGLVPLVVVQHGLGTRRSRTSALSIASVFASAGLAVAAIDLPLHGDRSFCNPARGNAECVPGHSCVPIPSRASQGDPAGMGPGACWTTASPADPDGVPDGALAKRPSFCVAATGCDDPGDWPTGWEAAAGGGVPYASSEFFISTNFFRVRDTLRQHVLDASQLVRVLTPSPASPPVGHAVFDALLGAGTLLSPLEVSLVGDSLGAIAGVLDLAANPRFGRAVFEATGGTVVDVVLSSPDFAGAVPELLAPLGCAWPPTDPAQAAGCLPILHLMKWILDPAEPINFARHVTSNTLPNLLAGGGIPGNEDGTQRPKDVLAQFAVCDQTITNPFSALLAGNLGLAPFVAPSAPGGTGTVQWYAATTGPAVPDVYPGSGCAAGARVQHAFLLNWGAWYADEQDREALRQATVVGQETAAAFLLDPGPVPSLVVVPQP
jgi:hypothetical protein